MASLRAPVETYMRKLQDDIIAAFGEQETSGAAFTRAPWSKPPGGALQGGGVMATMSAGPEGVFEKVGVNFSCVHGTFSEAFRKEIPGGADAGGAFWACGVSVVAHMANPFAPSVHFNVRRIETAHGWFGGGADLTPTIPFEEDNSHFHSILEKTCESHRPGSHKEYKDWCDRYFFLPHRGEARGVGGIFFDNLATPDPQADFRFVQAVGAAFLEAFIPLVAKRKRTPFTGADRERQLVKRGRYAEFNLLYDRGTRFGLMTGGNPEAILMSLPPLAKWP